MILAVDASLAVRAVLSASAFDPLAGHRLVAPPLMWTEAVSVLHVQLWRGRLTAAQAEGALDRLQRAQIERLNPPDLLRGAWQIAEELGVAKTYDAEYLALARLEGGKVVTIDARMRRGADRLGLVILPTEL